MSRSTAVPSKQGFVKLRVSLTSNMDRTPLAMKFDSISREYKTRNVLSLEERVQAIRAYERNPIYHRIAEQFNCSSKQIKNILAHKEALLCAFKERKLDSSTTEARRRRHQKIQFLGKVIYEFIRRCVYFNKALSAEKVRRMALDVRESIAIVNFYPNNIWLANFKTQYDLPTFEVPELRKTMILGKHIGRSFKCIDLIEYVSAKDKEQQQQQEHEKQNDNHFHDARNIVKRHAVASTIVHADEAVMTIKTEEPELQTKGNLIMEFEDTKPKLQVNMLPSMPEVLNLPDVTNYQDALRHLKVLEEFVMLQGNYRAIGLIGQLEQIFKNPPVRSYFEE